MAGLYLYANAQVVPSPGPPIAIACAFNTVPPTLTSGQAGWVQCTNAGKIQVDASVSASISGFAPGGAFATLTATGSSASVALPTGAVVIFQNAGTTAVSCTLGVGSATALASENIIQPASWLALTVGSNTFGACIDQTGSASNLVVLSGGTGLPTGAGGGSGSGGGGAVTVADGADVAQGTTTDAACATDNGTCTEIALIKRENQRLTSIITALGSPFQAGASIGNTSFASPVADGANVALGTTTDGACAGDATSGCTELARLSRIAARLSTLITNLGTSNTNGQKTPGNSSPVVQAGLLYETVAASQTGQTLGATGGTGDYLSHCVVYPTTTTPGVVTVFDNTSSAANNAIAFPGGASSVSNLVPISIPVGAFSLNGAWKVTTGANLVVTCYGNFAP